MRSKTLGSSLRKEEGGMGEGGRMGGAPRTEIPREGRVWKCWDQEGLMLKARVEGYWLDHPHPFPHLPHSSARTSQETG